MDFQKMFWEHGRINFNLFLPLLGVNFSKKLSSYCNTILLFKESQKRKMEAEIFEKSFTY